MRWGSLRKGYVVFGTAMNDAEVRASDGRVSLSLCDIVKEQDVKAWAGRVSCRPLAMDAASTCSSATQDLTPGPLEVCHWTPSVANSTSTYLARCPS